MTLIILVAGAIFATVAINAIKKLSQRVVALEQFQDDYLDLNKGKKADVSDAEVAK